MVVLGPIRLNALDKSSDPIQIAVTVEDTEFYDQLSVKFSVEAEKSLLLEWAQLVDWENLELLSLVEIGLALANVDCLFTDPLSSFRPLVKHRSFEVYIGFWLHANFMSVQVGRNPYVRPKRPVIVTWYLKSREEGSGLLACNYEVFGCAAETSDVAAFGRELLEQASDLHDRLRRTPRQQGFDSK